MVLPIDVMPDTNPPIFKWQVVFDTHGSPRLIDCMGTLMPSVENAMLKMIELAKQQAQEIASLKEQIKSHCERIAAQSELLSKKSERGDSHAPTTKKGK